MPTDVTAKLRILADAAKYDASCASSGGRRKRPEGGLGNAEGMGICHSYTPDGRCVSLLKILLTNYCVYDCAYCINRISSDTPRARFTVQEVVDLTISFYKRNYIEGLFLSSGVIQDADYTMAQLTAVARKLREEHGFGGYIHLKAVPGASEESLDEAGRHADRLSANIELPTQTDLDQLAPAKTHAETEQSMGLIQIKLQESKDRTRQGTSAPRYAPAGQSTQMIVGATPSTDTSILTKASDLYNTYGLRRVYYSAFSPIPDSNPLLPSAQAPLVREHRLYQADWLMRFYGFQAQEITEGTQGNLPLDKDPKLAWALRHREHFPVDVNRASKEALLRVPGLGVKNVERLLRVRRFQQITLDVLAKLHVNLTKARYFVATADYNHDVHRLDRQELPKMVVPPQQINLFEAAQTALTGQL